MRKGSQISGSEDVWDITEFFIVRGYRHRGVGMKAAHDLWRRFRGKWEIRVIDRKQNAKRFWTRAVNEFVGAAIIPTQFTKDGEGWHLFAFESIGAEQ